MIRIITSIFPAVVLLAFFATSANAALSQDAISSSSGFIGAYGGLQAGANPNAGQDIEPFYLPGEFVSDEAVFTSGAGSVSVSTSFTHALGTNSASGTVQAGLIKTFATNSASNAGFSAGSVVAGWNDLITIDSPGLTGTHGVWLYTINVSGSLSATGFAGSAGVELHSYKDNQILEKSDAPGFDAGGSDLIGTAFQYGQWGKSSQPSGTRLVSDTVTFAVPITFGEAFTLGVYTYTAAGKRSSSSVTGISTSEADFQNTFAWGGTVEVTAGGNQVAYTLSSASGIDWVAPVPLPPALLLFLSALSMLRFKQSGQA